MEADVRRKSEMADRVHLFNVAHPFDDASYTAVVTMFEDHRRETAALAEQERAGRVTARAATKRKNELRRLVQSELLRHLSRVGGVAGKGMPEVAERFKLPLANGSFQTFLAAARGMLAEAQASKTALAKWGLTDGILAELTESVEELERVAAEAQNGTMAHVGARADLREVARAQVALAGVLDGLQRRRFRDDPDVLAAWGSARNVVRPGKKASAEPEEESGSVPSPENGITSVA